MPVLQVDPFKQRDWEAKRRENDLKDVTQAGSKLGIKAEVIKVWAQYFGLVKWGCTVVDATLQESC